MYSYTNTRIDCLQEISFHFSHGSLYSSHICIKLPSQLPSFERLVSFHGVILPSIISDDQVCNACKKPETYESIVHNYCDADFGKSLNFHFFLSLLFSLFLLFFSFYRICNITNCFNAVIPVGICLNIASNFYVSETVQVIISTLLNYRLHP